MNTPNNLKTSKILPTNKEKFIKKFIVLIFITACFAILGITTSYYLNEKKLLLQEETAQNIMKNQFSEFVQTWNISAVPTLFIENAEINEISKYLIQVKNELGVCKVKNISKCQSNERLKETKRDMYYTQNGYSLNCTFNLDCEKFPASGEAIFLPTSNLVKMYSFSLTFDE